MEIKMKNLSHIIAIFAIIFSTSCSQNSVHNRIKLADKIAKKSGFQKAEISTKDFKFLTFSRITDQNKPLSVYIEGDGFAWKNKYTISHNPTPKDPISLKLAAIDENPNILYIARPCQYVDLEQEKNCHNRFWTASRFSKRVVKNVNLVINKFVQDFGFKKVNMYGYSGGAAIAILIASKRNDIRSIKTVAGNLNHKYLMKFHKVSPLYNSLDAIDVAQNVAQTWQYHLIGGKDKIVTRKASLSFINKAKKYNNKRVNFGVVKEAPHRYKNWPEEWAKTFVKKSEKTVKVKRVAKKVEKRVKVKNKPKKRKSIIYKLKKGVKKLF